MSFLNKFSMAKSNLEVLVARMEEKIKPMHEDIKEIKESVKVINGCVRDNEIKIVKNIGNITALSDSISNHLESHNNIMDWSLKKIGLVIAGTSVIVTIVFFVLSNLP